MYDRASRSLWTQPTGQAVAGARTGTELAASGRPPCTTSSSGGRSLTFTAAGPDFRDDQTGSTWTVAGLAVTGPLRGRHLTRLPSQDAFWFAWAAFNPTTGLAA